MSTKAHPEKPLILQSDRTVTLEVFHPRYEEVRDRLAQFAELEKSPEHLHTYRITPISVWNAAALGVPEESILEFLQRNSRYPLPKSLVGEVSEWYRRYGLLRLEKAEGRLALLSSDPAVLREVLAHRAVQDLVRGKGEPGVAYLDEADRGQVKQALIQLGYPVEDLAGYLEGSFLAFSLRRTTRKGLPFSLRPYQREAAGAFFAGGSARGGSGVIVLPCGSGKTIVGIGVMDLLKTYTLILTTSTVAVHQWRDELLDKSTLSPDQVGEYTGEAKDVRPVTISTYQMLTYRRRKTERFEHFDLFLRQNWGLVVYDEVHLLPAPVFRITADIQARRRLGLTATLVREDGKEGEVFCLIGPKRCDVPWKLLERQGFIATARCLEVRVPLEGEDRLRYAAEGSRAQFRLASENPAKMAILRGLIDGHASDQVLVIGQYLDQLQRMALAFRAPLITGRTPIAEREKLYSDFRAGRIRLLFVSKVGNFAIDLPDANVAIQVSGTFGSRQEEAQRLGRILRPKGNGELAFFYSVVTRDSRDQDFAEKRQRFLTEQGYAYEIVEPRNLDDRWNGAAGRHGTESRSAALHAS